MTGAAHDILAQGLTTVREETRVELARWSTDNALLVGVILSAAALYAVAWMYRREGRGEVSTGLRRTLVACRVSVLVLLGLIGLEPVLATYIHRRLDAYTLILADQSASMSLVDHYRVDADAARVEEALGSLPAEGVRRSALAEQLINRGGGRILNDLAEKNHVKLFTFGEGLTPRGLVVSRRDSEADDVDDADGSGGSDRSGDSSLDESSASNDTPGGKGEAGGEDGASGSDVAAGNAPRERDASEVDPPEAGASSTTRLRLRPEEPATNVGLAIRHAIDSVVGSPVAAVVLLTDGGFNEGEDPAVVARFLKQKGIPTYVVGVGDPADPINVRVAEVTAPRSVFKNDPFSVTVRIDAEGVGDRALVVELLERDAESSSPAKVVESRSISPDADGRFAPTVFERKVETPGSMTYLARVRPLAYEAVTSDNQREILPAVRILDDQMRVLLIAGGPSYDYRYLMRLLERDVTVELSTWLQSADVNAVRDGNTIITELPAQPEELFSYDALIMLDCDPRELDPTWGSMVATFVADHGGGILYAAGHKYTGRFFRSPKAASIVELLPIVPDQDAELLLNDLGHYQTRAWPLLIPDDALLDPILRLADDAAANLAVWSSLEGVYWHYPVRREKPVATDLLRHSNPRMANGFGQHVLFATQFVGAGRSAFLAINTTWRWRRGDESRFNRFWIQTLRFLVEGKLLGGRQRGSISTQRQQYDLGDSVVITARALDESFQPLQMPELSLDVALQPSADVGANADDSANGDDRADGVAGDNENADANDKTTVSLAPVPGRDGYYQGRFVPRQTGTYRLGLELGGDDETRAMIEKDIVVTAPDLEMRRPAMRRAALMQFAEAAGGEYFDVDQMATIAERVQDRSRSFVTRERPRPLWDNKYVLIALVLLLTIEWILRKKARLL